MSNPYLVITQPDLEGAKIQARSWLEKNLAANVNVLPKMDSMYQWKGELRHGQEHKIIIKTSANRLTELDREISSAHPYPMAEILHFKIDSGNSDTLNWISQSTQ
jgi:periplasmic divalent cation tolerance protein